MSQPLPDPSARNVDSSVLEPARPPCPAPANIRAEVNAYDATSEVGQWAGPRYRMSYRIKGQGPPLILVPGLASTYRTYALLLNQLGDRFRTILYDYPGENVTDGANLAQINHDQLVDDLFGLIDHLKIGRVFLVGTSFGSTIVLKALHREGRRFPRTAVQGAFAHRDFSRLERWALRLGQLIPGTSQGLPLRRTVLTYNNKLEFPAFMEDRWTFYLEQNGLITIRAMAHRIKLLAHLDLRPILAAILAEVLLIHGNEDRIVSRRYYEELKNALPRAEGVVLPTVGHQPQLTHAEILSRLIGDWLLPCAPGGCPQERS